MTLVLVELAIKHLKIDARCQARAAFSLEYAETMAEVLRAAIELPPVVVFRDVRRCYWLADGHHRHRAHLLVGRMTMTVDLREGSLRDAQLFAAGSNKKHGLHRSIEDKRRAVLLLLQDEEWGDRMLWPNLRVAEHCGVSAAFVGNLREELRIDNERNLNHEGNGHRQEQMNRIAERRKSRSVPCGQQTGTERIQANQDLTEVFYRQCLRDWLEALETGIRCGLNMADRPEALRLTRAALAALRAAAG